MADCFSFVLRSVLSSNKEKQSSIGRVHSHVECSHLRSYTIVKSV